MTKTFKNLFALQKGTVATLCIVYALFITLASCDRQVPILEWEDEEPATSQVKGEEVGEGKPMYEFYYGGSLINDNELVKNYLLTRNDFVFVIAESPAVAQELSEHEIFVLPLTFDPSLPYLISRIDPEKTKLEDVLKLPGVVDAKFGYRSVLYPSFDALDNFVFTTNHICVALFYEDQLSIENIINDSGLREFVVSVELRDYPSLGYSNYVITSNVRLADVLRITRELTESLAELGFRSFSYPNIGG